MKEQIKYVSPYFEHVYVIIPIWYGLSIIRNNVYKDYSYNNVSVLFPRYFNIPLFYFFLRPVWIKFSLNAILKTITKKNIKFDIIHAHFTWPAGKLAVELKKIFQKPVLITEHGVETFYNILYRKDKYCINAWMDCDTIIRVNRNDITLFEKVGINKNKIKYIPNGYDKNRFKLLSKNDVKKELKIPENMKILLNVSNLKKRKGQSDLVISMHELCKKLQYKIICYIGGVGPFGSVLKRLVKKYKLDENIKFLNYISHNDLPLWYNACDLFIFPSHAESFGIVQIEALACGAPVIAAKNVGSAEIITSDKIGILYNPNNIQELTEKIYYGLDKEWDRNYISKFATIYCWDNITNQIVNLYESII